MNQRYGPYRLGPIDLLISSTVLRFLICPITTRLFSVAIAGVCILIVISGLSNQDYAAVAVGLGLLLFVFMVAPLLSGLRRKSVVIETRPEGLLAISDETENLYKTLDVDRMRLIGGRLLVPFNGSCAIIVPGWAIGADRLAELQQWVVDFGSKNGTEART